MKKVICFLIAACLLTFINPLKAENKNDEFLDPKEIETLNLFSDNMDFNKTELRTSFYFCAANDRCSLLPVCDLNEHKECFLRLFSRANQEYMKFYLDGKLMKEDSVISWFESSKESIKKVNPRSLTFMIKLENNVIGRIGVGPLFDRKGVDAEIGYTLEEKYTGKRIMSKAVDIVIEFLKLLKLKTNNTYDFTRLRATADIHNIPSNKILTSHGFKKSDSTIIDKYGEKNEYFLQF